MDADAVDPLGAAGDLTGGEIEAFWGFDFAFVDRGVEAALGEDVDDHGEGERVREERVFATDDGEAGDGVAFDDRHEGLFDHGDDPGEELGVFELVAV